MRTDSRTHAHTHLLRTRRKLNKSNKNYQHLYSPELDKLILFFMILFNISKKDQTK